MASETEMLRVLKDIKADLDYLKKHIKDVDLVLTDDDMEALEEAEKDLKEEKTQRLV